MIPCPPKERKLNKTFKRNSKLISFNNIILSLEGLRNYESFISTKDIDDLECDIRYLSRQLNIYGINKSFYLKTLYNQEIFICKKKNLINWIQMLLKYTICLKVAIKKQKDHKSFVDKLDNDIKIISDDLKKRIGKFTI